MPSRRERPFSLDRALRRGMRNVFVWSGSRPILSLALALTITLAFLTGLPRLGVSASVEQALSPSDPKVGEWREIRENFGVRPLVIATVRLPEPFSEASLEQLREYGEALARIEGVERSVGLFNAPGFDPGRDGAPIPGPWFFATPGLDESTVRAGILGDPLYRGIFVDEAGETAVFYLAIELEREGEWNHQGILDRLSELRRDFADRWPQEAHLGFLGIPVSLETAKQYAYWNVTRLGPFALLVVVAVVLLFFRSAASVFLPLATTVLSVSATLGFMGLVGYDVSPYLSTVVVLVAVLGCTEDLHILSGYMRARESGRAPREALALVGSAQGTALLLTSATTVLSFASIALTEIPALRSFAVTCAFGMAVNFVVTVLAAPALLRFSVAKRGERREQALLQRLETLLRRWLAQRPRQIALLFAGGFALCFWGASRMEIDTDSRRFFHESSEFAQEFRDFARRFGGDTPVTVTFETHRRKGALAPGAIANLRLLHRFVEDEGGIAFGHLSLFEAYRRAKHRDREGGPPSESESADLASFADLPAIEMIGAFLDYDGSRASVSLLIDAPNARAILDFEERLLAFAEEHLDPAFEVRVSGDAVLIAHVCERIGWQLLGSLLVLSLAVFAMISLLFRSLALGLLALVPNLFPIAVTFGAMGWLGMPLGLATFPVAAVAFGIAVDDTIHFLSSFREGRRRGRSPRAAAFAAIGKELRPVLATSALAVSGCLVLLASPMRSTGESGLLFVLACVSALAADLLLTPLLLARFGGVRRKKR